VTLPASTSGETLARWLADPKGSSTLILIDVRELSEWTEGHLAKALHCPLSSFDDSWPKLNGGKTFDQDQPIVIICRSGRRSAKALELLKARGFKNLSNLDGGLLSCPLPLIKP
jgi:rhodanese-related sulfurtransferase